MNGRRSYPVMSYGSDPVGDAAIIASDCVRHGKSGGWSGSIAQREAVAAVLKPYGVRYTDDMMGEWSAPNAHPYPLAPPCDVPSVSVSRVLNDGDALAFEVRGEHGDRDGSGSGRTLWITARHWPVLRSIGNGRHVRGREVILSRTLEEIGLLRVEVVRGPREERRDGNHYATVTPLGLAVLAAGATEPTVQP